MDTGCVPYMEASAVKPLEGSTTVYGKGAKKHTQAHCLPSEGSPCHYQHTPVMGNKTQHVAMPILHHQEIRYYIMIITSLYYDHYIIIIIVIMIITSLQVIRHHYSTLLQLLFQMIFLLR